jgi:hypothetical protein
MDACAVRLLHFGRVALAVLGLQYCLSGEDAGFGWLSHGGVVLVSSRIPNVEAYVQCVLVAAACLVTCLHEAGLRGGHRVRSALHKRW